MSKSLPFYLAALLVGIAGGVAVGYWEARPWSGRTDIAVSERTHVHADGTVHTGDHAEEGDDARAVAPETTFKFGNMESGATQRHTFPIKNEGAVPLTVKFVSHTCKCTEVRLGGELVEPGAGITVPPGGDDAIMLEWAAKQPPGPFRHGATFTTNDPQLGRLEIIVEGEIVASTTLEPPMLAFGALHTGQPGKAEMTVMAFLDPTVEITEHEVLGEQIVDRMQVEIVTVAAGELPNPQAKAGVKVVATFDPGGTVGSFAGALRLKTTLKNAESFEVPVTGEVKGDISIYGPGGALTSGLVRIAPTKSAEGRETRLNVNIRGEHAAETRLSVERVEPSELQVTLGEPEKVRDGLVRVPLMVAIPAGTRPMAMVGEDQGGVGEIVLASTHPDTKQVRLQVHFTVLP
jgi:hypothetical protein